MRVAVTGASGFIGRQVVARLVERDDTEIVTLTRKPMEAWSDHPKVQNIICDISEDKGKNFADIGAPDILMHLAWGGLPNFKAPSHVTAELPAQFRFLDTLVQSGLKHLLVTGTCLEYGVRNGPLAETLSPQPTNSYGYAKAALHQLLCDLQATEDFSLVWARIFYLYGSLQYPSAIYQLLRSAVERNDPTFPMSMGEQLRDYLTVEQVADVLVQLALPLQSYGIVNVCSGRPISIRRLVENWITANNWAIVPERGVYPYPDYEAMAFWGDRSKLDMLLSCELNFDDDRSGNFNDQVLP